MSNGSKKTRAKKRITGKEKKFAELMVYENMGSIEAGRKAFDWSCDPGTYTAQRAVNLARSPRIAKYRKQLQARLDADISAQQVLVDTSSIEMDSMRQYIYKRLVAIRDDTNASGNSRFKAIAALEKMVDPAADVNLILMWVDIVWRAAMAHCPCCHKTFPMRQINNPKLYEFRDDVMLPTDVPAETLFDRRMTILERADVRKKPHPGQVIALSAPERNIAGLGAAQSGKSLLLAQFALLGFLIPGVEVWILARVYAAAEREIEYLDKFLNTLFFPYTKHLITRREDKKTEELTLESKWNSVLKVKSAKALGSITGQALELALIAEPGWVPDDVFNHLRARMTSRLGRTVLLGTPQGFGGILGRFVNMTGRDAKGRAKRIPASERTIAAGCPWNISLLKYSLDPTMNPEYVASEIEAARQELTEAEFASEFQGLMSTAEGAMFPQLAERHLTEISRELYERCVWVLGVDQGPKNFAAVLLGYDGQTIVTANEYFDNDPRTVQSKMAIIKDLTPNWIRKSGGDPSRWRLTIFDSDPPVLNELDVFEDEGSPWPTDYTFRVKDMKGRYTQENWRRETYEYLNSLAQAATPNIYFDVNTCDFLHDQLLRAQARKGDDGMSRKGWIIQDAVRGDHVPDAFIMALFTIMSGQLIIPDREFEVDDVYADAKKAFDYNIRRYENDELKGFVKKNPTPDEQFKETFGRPRHKPVGVLQPKQAWHYKDY